jgi:uncharacterized protein (DUF1778 family)
MSNTSKRRRINCSFAPHDYARLVLAAAGISVTAFVTEAALRAAGREGKAINHEEVRRILIAIRQAADALGQIGMHTSRGLKMGVFDGLKAKRRLYEIECALIPLLTRHGD